jgi:16S rRNA (uracil1498-N3)-methyltransferase
VLPNDGRLLRCEFDGREATVLAIETLHTEPKRKILLAQALPKPDKLDEVIRLGTEIGVASFLIFPSERSVVRWDAAKLQDRLRRLRTIAREAAEVSFRARLPEVDVVSSLNELLARFPRALVLSEVEGVSSTLADHLADEMTLVIGPEGGWAPREVALIGDRALTLGPRVLRVDTAACAAATLTLLQ